MTPRTPTSSTETLIPIPNLTPTTPPPTAILLAYHCPPCGRLHLQPNADPHNHTPPPATMTCVANTTGTENATCHFERLTHFGDIDIRDGKVGAGDERAIKETCWGPGNRLCEKKACGKVQANHWRWKCEGGGGEGGGVGVKGKMGKGGVTAGKGGVTAGKVKARAGVGVVVVVGACLAVWWAVVSMGEM